MVSRKRKNKYNLIQVGCLKIASSKTDMKELLKMADQLLTKHKEIIKDKDIWEIPLGSIEYAD